jgi:hypothetical protein
MRVAETREVELAREGEALAARRTLIERGEAELERSARRAEEKRKGFG